jgi:hypothetical protein
MSPCRPLPAHSPQVITPVILAAAESVCASAGSMYSLASLPCSLGSMIEVPRACIRSDRIAEAAHIDYISIASTALTQFMFGFSRYDVHHFISTYIDKNLIAADPFDSLDVNGVGGMIQMAVRRARRVKPHLKVPPMPHAPCPCSLAPANCSPAPLPPGCCCCCSPAALLLPPCCFPACCPLPS